MTTTNIRRWGNSQGLYIPINMLRQLGIAVNSSVTLALENNAIVIRKADFTSDKAAAFESLQKIRNDALLQRKTHRAESDVDFREQYLEYLDERFGSYIEKEQQ